MSSPGFDLLVRLVPAFAPPFLRGLMSTCSIAIHNRKVWDDYVVAKKPYIGVVWHKDFLFVLDWFRRKPIVVMVSRSKDGELVARSLERIGYRTVRGSSSTGGSEALFELRSRLLDGWAGAIVADGPKGPARKSKLGPVIASKETGVPYIAFGCHMEPAWRMRNWDQTAIPKPGARIAVAFGTPTVVPPEATREECEAHRERIDAEMASLEAICRRRTSADA